jgi:hypothetical protein
MADARATQVSHARRTVVWAWLAFYLVAAWIAVTGGFALFARNLSPVFGTLASAQTAVEQFLATTGAVSHAVTPFTPAVVAFVVAALLVDALLAATIFIFHRTVRPQLAARLAPTSEG